jgi:CIC family chloride channel protein
VRLLRTAYQRIFFFIRNKLTRPQYITLVATLTGLVSGLVAVLLKIIVHYLQKSFSYGEWYYLLLPAIGLVLTVLIIKYLFSGILDKGIAMVLKAIAKKSSFIPTSNIYKHIATSSLTVGLGGSAGLEAPIVATGASYGSFFGRITDLTYQERTLMIACGAAAGIAAVFNAPIAGVIFAIEVLLTETMVSYFIPLTISAVAGVLCSKIILQETILFNFALKQEFNYHNVPYYLILGVVAGFISLYYARVFKSVEKKLHEFKWNIFLKALTGGALLAALIFIFPPLFGEGYQSVGELANGNAEGIVSSNLFNLTDSNVSVLIFIGSIMLLKPVATAITLGAGGNGGNFAPSLFVGSYLGFFFSRFLNTTGLVKVPEGNFSLVGMAGVLSGVMYCPLTAIFLIAEITNGYGLFIPLMIVSAISFFIVKHFEPFSMELKKLAMGGEVFTHKKEQNILTSIQLESILAENYKAVPVTGNLGSLVEEIKKSEKNIFAITDEKEKFLGVIELNDIKKMLFDPGKYETTSLRSITKKPRDIIYNDESMQKVMDKFDHSQTWYLPVLDREKNFIGFISKTRLFEKYREVLSAQSDLYEI